MNVAVKQRRGGGKNGGRTIDEMVGTSAGRRRT